MHNSLEEIEDYLQEVEDFNIKNNNFSSFIKSYDLIHKEMSILDSKISNLNLHLKPYDLIDFLLSKSIPNRNLGSINRIMQDLKLIEKDLNEEYASKFNKVYNKVLKVGNEIVKDKIKNKIESLYLNNDLITYIVLLDNKEEVMREVIEKRIEICNIKIEFYDLQQQGGNQKGGDKEERGTQKEGGKEEGCSDQHDDYDNNLNSSFYFLLVNQEINLWSLLFPSDLNLILKRLISLDLPLGYSKFERFVYAIFKVYFWEEKNLKGKLEEIHLKIKDKKEILKSIKEIEKYTELKFVHEWVYDALLYKSLKEYLSDGIIEI
ncbi:hypothetical protein NBO_514g0002 [Nosema bombycis CQ1]|uniref:Uncharacterized protein n=1 Tax=Nosema bombycis (strain CQ1 / CVCC 102059) TaxID=578461 RepID=R0KPM0_NOSB1|nr:hypothetical protein NBO_514g0002 [Nosema bombycis CQ1]|eukprot:EOB12137.1 hypothetical protein NBO_514g0002 [Nosema bombycis CQ1]